VRRFSAEKGPGGAIPLVLRSRDGIRRTLPSLRLPGLVRAGAVSGRMERYGQGIGVAATRTGGRVTYDSGRSAGALWLLT
jgi:hypothetical protein